MSCYAMLCYVRLSHSLTCWVTVCVVMLCCLMLCYVCHVMWCFFIEPSPFTLVWWLTGPRGQEPEAPILEQVSFSSLFNQICSPRGGKRRRRRRRRRRRKGEGGEKGEKKKRKGGKKRRKKKEEEKKKKKKKKKKKRKRFSLGPPRGGARPCQVRSMPKALSLGISWAFALRS